MAKSTKDELMDLVKKLQAERAEYEKKIAEIDSVLEPMGLSPASRGKPGPKKGSKNTRKKSGRKKRGTFAKTAEESIYDYVKANPNATSADVNQHWTDEGRGGRADNTITRLVKDGRLKRTPLKGKRGSSLKAV